MNVFKNTALAFLACATIASCSGTDAWLVKNTGLTSTDAILLGVKAKDRVELTLKEYNDAKNRNLPSGKEVVSVSPEPTLEPVKEPTMWDKAITLWNLF